MTILPQLSDEIVDAILSYPGASEQVISLYLCGCSSINARLLRCVTVFRMENRVEARKMFRIPGLLFSLSKLRELEIYSDKWVNKLPEVVQQIQALPSTLKLLHITNSSPFLLCSHFRWMPAKQGKAPYWLPTVDKQGCFFFDVKAHFPALEDLKLKSAEKGYEIRISPQDWLIFPPTLRKLEWFDARVIGATDITNMPPLTSLNFGFHQFSDATFAKLPSSLRAIDGQMPPYTFFLPHLPRHLTSLGAYEVANFDIDVASSLPPCLTSLLLKDDIKNSSFEQRGLNWTHGLPPNLTLLKLPPEGMVEIDIRHLPRKLTTIYNLNLGVGHFNHPLKSLVKKGENDSPISSSSSQGELWPPKLRTLSIHHLPFSSDFALGCLPTTLTDLSINIDFQASQVVLPLFPPLLTHLSLIFLWPNSFLGQNPLILLKHLRSLELQTPILDPFFISVLPPSLVELNLVYMCGSENFEQLTHIPPHLEVLKLCVAPPSIVALLPPKLTSLTLVWEDVISEELLALPSTLTHLDVRFESKVAAADCKLFSRLPDAMRYLTINNHLPIEAFQYLDHRIRYLSADLKRKVSLTAASLRKIHARWIFWLSKHVSRKDSELLESVLSKKKWSPSNPY